MSTLRAALHECADILADALEAQTVEAKPAKKKRRSPTHNPRPPREVSELAMQRAERALTRLGIPFKAAG